MVLIADWNVASTDEEITDFMIVPPQIPQFEGTAWAPELKAYLMRRFPTLTFSVTVDDGFRDGEDVIVLPVVGTAGDETNPGHWKAVTTSTKHIMREVAAAVKAFVPGGTAHLN